MIAVTMDLENLRPHVHVKKRSGRPRYQWTASALDLYWLLVREDTTYKYTSLDWEIGTCMIYQFVVPLCKH